MVFTPGAGANGMATSPVPGQGAPNGAAVAPVPVGVEHPVPGAPPLGGEGAVDNTAATNAQLTQALHYLHAQQHAMAQFIQNQQQTVPVPSAGQNPAWAGYAVSGSYPPPGSMPGASAGWHPEGPVEPSLTVPGGGSQAHGGEGPVAEGDDDRVVISAKELAKLKAEASKAKEAKRASAPFPPEASRSGNLYYVPKASIMTIENPGVVCGWRLTESLFTRDTTWSTAYNQNQIRGFTTLDSAVDFFFRENAKKWTVTVRKG